MMAVKSIFFFAGFVFLAASAAEDQNLNKRGGNVHTVGCKAASAAEDQNLNKRGGNVHTVGCKGNSCPHPKDVFHPNSCLDYLRQGASKCGIYKIYDNSGNTFPAYCDLSSEPGSAWTLVMSWSQANVKIPEFKRRGFKTSVPVNENSQNWKMYRLGLTRMKSLQYHSTHWRATCSYPTHGVDFTDYIRGSFKDFNIVDFIGGGQCKKIEYVNIRGHVGIHVTARFHQSTTMYLHIDSSQTGCKFNPSSDAVSSEDNFGYYGTINPKFRCTQGPQSTTQWWFGGHL